MAKTLDELRTAHPRTPKAPAGPDADPRALPYWVVVLSRKDHKKTGEARFKYVFGYATEGEAEAARWRRQREADELAAAETARTAQTTVNQNNDLLARGLPPVPDRHPVQPFQFFVVERPEGGVLA